MSIVPPEAQAIIDQFSMSKIPHEGPWFAPTAKSSEILEGAAASRYKGERYLYSAILVLFTREDFSAMHKLLTDEIWHFYGGWPMELLLLYPDGSGETRRLGNNVVAGESPQIMVSADTWMGSSPIGPEDVTYTLAGNTLTPGFEYDDYVPGFREELVSAYPDFAERIVTLTRDRETGILAV